jgi:hypothetical protein
VYPFCKKLGSEMFSDSFCGKSSHPATADKLIAGNVTVLGIADCERAVEVELKKPMLPLEKCKLGPEFPPSPEVIASVPTTLILISSVDTTGRMD